MSFEEVPTERLEELANHWERKARGSASPGKTAAYRSMKAELESRDGSGSRGDSEATETASMAGAIGNSGSTDAFEEFDHAELSAARERYAEAADEYGGPWEDVLAALDEEIDTREDTTVAELSVATSSGTSGPYPDEPTAVSGIAIGHRDETTGSSGTTKVWHGEALRSAVDSLEGKPIVANHTNDDVREVVGEVSDASWSWDQKGVTFEGEIDDPEIAQKIERGRLDVSARVRHAPAEELSETAEGKLHIKDASDIRQFDNLSVVTHGAAPSNEIRAGSGR